MRLAVRTTTDFGQQMIVCIGCLYGILSMKLLAGMSIIELSTHTFETLNENISNKKQLIWSAQGGSSMFLNQSIRAPHRLTICSMHFLVIDSKIICIYIYNITMEKEGFVALIICSTMKKLHDHDVRRTVN